MADEVVAGQDPAVKAGEAANSAQPVDGAQGTPVDRAPVPAPGNGDAGGSGCAPDSASSAQLTPGKMALLAALLESSDMRLAAKAAGISHVTAYRWLKDPAFHKELTRQRNDVFAETLAAVKSHATKAVTQLAELMAAPENGVRAKVCTNILDRALKVHNLQDVNQRISALEKAAQGKTGAQRQ